MSKKLTGDDLLKRRKQLDLDMSKNWGVMRTENVLRKGTPRYYSTKGTWKLIQSQSQERIKVKMAIHAFNMGISSMKEISNDCLYWKILELAELRELMVGLNKVETIPSQKKKELGKYIKDTEEITRDALTNMKRDIQQKINVIVNFLNEKNAKNTIEF